MHHGMIFTCTWLWSMWVLLPSEIHRAMLHVPPSWQPFTTTVLSCLIRVCSYQTSLTLILLSVYEDNDLPISVAVYVKSPLQGSTTFHTSVFCRTNQSISRITSRAAVKHLRQTVVYVCYVSDSNLAQLQFSSTLLCMDHRSWHPPLNSVHSNINIVKFNPWSCRRQHPVASFHSWTIIQHCQEYKMEHVFFFSSIGVYRSMSE